MRGVLMGSNIFSPLLIFLHYIYCNRLQILRSCTLGRFSLFAVLCCVNLSLKIRVIISVSIIRVTVVIYRLAILLLLFALRACTFIQFVAGSISMTVYVVVASSGNGLQYLTICFISVGWLIVPDCLGY